MEIIIYVPRVRPIQRVDVRHASRDILESILMNPTRHTNVNKLKNAILMNMKFRNQVKILTDHVREKNVIVKME
jgi:hypothetical protein